MIPQGRAVKSEADVARECGLPLTTWRRREAPAFRRALRPVNPGERLKLYDAAQVDAYLSGDPLPPASGDDGEKPTPHPDDQLNDREAGAVLGVDAGTVRKYASAGYLSPGPRWPRWEVEARKAAPDQRSAEGQRWRDSTQRRSDEVARWLAEAARGAREPVTADEIARRHGVTVRTAYRTLAEARELTQ